MSLPYTPGLMARKWQRGLVYCPLGLQAFELLEVVVHFLQTLSELHKKCHTLLKMHV